MSDTRRPPVAAIGALVLLGLLAAVVAVGLLVRTPEAGLVDVRLLGSSIAQVSPRSLVLAAMVLAGAAVVLVGLGIWISAVSRRGGSSEETSIRNAGLEASNLLLERRVRSLEAEIEKLEGIRDGLSKETQSLGHRRIPAQSAPRSKMPFPRTSTAGESEPLVVVPDGNGEPSAAEPTPEATARGSASAQRTTRKAPAPEPR